MTKARVIKLKNQLGELFKQPGGRTLSEAVRGAEARLERIGGDCLEAMDDALGRLTSVTIHDSAGPDEGATDILYRASNDIIGMAGLTGHADLGEVARGLCDMIDGYRAGEPWLGGAVRLHIDAMRLLRNLDLKSHAARLKVLNGLRAVWARLDKRAAQLARAPGAAIEAGFVRSAQTQIG
ncbi:MAG: hypothetical protein P4L64_10155 [Caulobacteraceae bacterium]|nr:hypothetical protein [Caulobacteraceae bacterium]